MIIVVSKFKTLPGHREGLLAAAAPCIEATHREEACISYVLTNDTQDENSFIFVESWKSLDGLRAHLASPHLVAFREARAPHIDKASADLKVYEGEEANL